MRARGDYMERRTPNGDMPPNYRDRYSRDGPNDHPRQQYGGHRDGNHANYYQTGRQLEQLSISTSHAPKVCSTALDCTLPLLAFAVFVSGAGMSIELQDCCSRNTCLLA